MSDSKQKENIENLPQENHNIPLAGEIIEEPLTSGVDAFTKTSSDLEQQVDESRPASSNITEQPKPNTPKQPKEPVPPHIKTPEELKKEEEAKKKQKALINNVIKILMLLVGCCAVFFLIEFIFSVTNIDTQFIKITLYGHITDKVTTNPVKNASIIVKGKEVAKSDVNGDYSSTGLDAGKTTVTVKADGYNDLNMDVDVERSMLDYTTKQDFVLVSSRLGQLSGKLVANIDKYNFLGDQLLINDKAVTINSDGSFSADGITVGNASLKFKSINFKDLDQTIPIQTGTNQIQPIQLVPAGDILGVLKSWVREDLVLNTQFYVENVLQNQVDIGRDGSFAVKDLVVGKQYKIRVVAPGYQTRDYVLQIIQGNNELFNFKLVENTTAVFLGAGTNQQNANQFYKSDLDGLNYQPMTQFNQSKTYQEYYNKTENKLYFLTDQDKNSTDIVGLIRLPYSLDVSTGNLVRLVTNTSDLGTIDANFIAKKMVSIKPYRNGPDDASKIQVMDISGNNRQTIQSGTGYTFNNVSIADNAKALVYYQTGKNPGLYRYTLDNQQSTLISNSNNIVVFDISEDGKKVLFGRQNSSTGLNDLVLYNTDSNSTQVVKENFDGQQYRFVKGNNNQIVYFAHREDRDNVFLITIDQNKDDRITGLTPDYQIKAVYQQSGYVFYLTNRGLLVLDLTSPKNFKLVSTKATTYTGYNY